MNVTYVTNNEGAGDWEGLYVDGKLVAEGHSISVEEVLRNLIPAELTSLDVVSLTDEQMEELGYHLPKYWSPNLLKGEVKTT